MIEISSEEKTGKKSLISALTTSQDGTVHYVSTKPRLQHTVWNRAGAQ